MRVDQRRLGLVGLMQHRVGANKARPFVDARRQLLASRVASFDTMPSIIGRCASGMAAASVAGAGSPLSVASRATTMLRQGASGGELASNDW